jgi:VanZ family protein
MKKLLNTVEAHWSLLTVALLITISMLSLYPLDNLPKVPGTDKAHHLVAYSALVFPVAVAKPKWWPVIVTGLLVYSGLIELLQPYVNRYGEWRDFGANAIGLIVGIILASIANVVVGVQERAKEPL